MTTVERAKDGQLYIIKPTKAYGIALSFVVLLIALLTSTTRAATFAPYFYDVLITNRVDLDGDGYARQFDLLFDVDSNIAGQYYVRIYEYDGGFGFDDLLGTTATYSVNGTDVDYRGVRIECSSFPGSDLLSHGNAEFRLDLYNAANNSLIQSWTPGNDPDLNNVFVELASEDSVPVLTIGSVSPSALQPRGWGQSVTYTVTVRDTNGNPVGGATVFGTNGLSGMNFTTSPATTDVNGLISYTAVIPVCAPNAVYDLAFTASKPGYVTSQPVARQIQVNQPANRPPIALAASVSGQPSALRIGEVYSITADYSDPDGETHRCVKRISVFQSTGRKWRPAEDKLLGTRSDREIARLLNRSVRSVLKRRLRLRIPNRCSQVIRWTVADERLLGRLPDKVVAERLGRKPSAVLQRRRLKRIPPFRPGVTRRNHRP